MIAWYRYSFHSGRNGSGNDYNVFCIGLNVTINGSSVAISSEGC